MAQTVESDTSGIVGTLHACFNNENKIEGHIQTHWTLFCLCANSRVIMIKIFLDAKPLISQTGTHFGEETSAAFVDYSDNQEKKSASLSSVLIFTFHNTRSCI